MNSASKPVVAAKKQSILLMLYQFEIIKKLKLIELATKLLTIAGVIVFYTAIEKVPATEMLHQNIRTLSIFVLWQHVHCALHLNMEPILTNQRENALQYARRVGGTVFVYVVFFSTFVITLLWPFLSYYNFRMTSVDTDYYTLRYVYYFAYIVLNNLRIASMDNVQMLLADGLLLSQITSMLLYNELSLKLALFLLTPFLFLQNSKICYEVMVYQKERTRKSSFVRLLGAHDAIFVFLLFSFVICFINLIDAFAVNY